MIARYLQTLRRWITCRMYPARVSSKCLPGMMGTVCVLSVPPASVAIQVDPQPVGQRPESVLSYVTDLELVSSDDQVATASASAQATSSFSTCSTKDMMTESDGMGLGAPDRLSRSEIAESVTCPVPQSDACTLGQSTRSPSPSGSSSASSAPRRPNDTPPPLHAPSTFGGQWSASSWASTSCNPVSTRSGTSDCLHTTDRMRAYFVSCFSSIRREPPPAVRGCCNGKVCLHL